MRTLNVNIAELLATFEDTSNELLQILSTLSYEQINTIPYEGSWTAGQVAQHLVLSNSGFAEIINGPDKETERDPGVGIGTFKKTFLDFSIKMDSPEFVKPQNTTYEKEELMHALEAATVSIQKALLTLDLTKTCTAFELPVAGFLTRIEAVSFVTYHTQRHISQLKKIVNKVAPKFYAHV